MQVQETALGYVEQYVSTYASRDVAPVDHIDVETEPVDAAHPESPYVTFLVSEVEPPTSIRDMQAHYRELKKPEARRPKRSH
jgi:hypothetical protein